MAHPRPCRYARASLRRPEPRLHAPVARRGGHQRAQPQLAARAPDLGRGGAGGHTGRADGLQHRSGDRRGASRRSRDRGCDQGCPGRRSPDPVPDRRRRPAGRARSLAGAARRPRRRGGYSGGGPRPIRDAGDPARRAHLRVRPLVGSGRVGGRGPAVGPAAGGRRLPHGEDLRVHGRPGLAGGAAGGRGGGALQHLPP